MRIVSIALIPERDTLQAVVGYTDDNGKEQLAVVGDSLKKYNDVLTKDITNTDSFIAASEKAIAHHKEIRSTPIV